MTDRTGDVIAEQAGDDPGNERPDKDHDHHRKGDREPGQERPSLIAQYVSKC